MSYKHLNPLDRYLIQICHEMKLSANKISKIIGRSQSTISRELLRNSNQYGYQFEMAQVATDHRQMCKFRYFKMNCFIQRIVDKHIEIDKWSPEQIAGKLKLNNVVSLHHETIYRYVLQDKLEGGILYKSLRHQKTYRKRYGSAHNRTGIPNRVDIDERPIEANERQRIGDWEGDTIIGKNHKGAIVTLDDRKSKIRLAAPLKGKKASYVMNAIVELLGPMKDYVKTITFDNGKEFCSHEKIAEELDCNAYFAKPYHSWERGQNENANGLLRQYFPKSMELLDVKMKDVFHAVDALNSRPRKCLGYLTPYEYFQKETGINIKTIWGYAL